MLATLLSVALQAATAAAAAPTLPDPGAKPSVITNPDWLRIPKREDLAKYYPKAAAKEDLAGSGFLACAVSAEGRLIDCKAEKVSPEGVGFAEAILAAAEVYRMRPLLIDGRPAAGGTVRLPMNFLLPGDLRSAPVKAHHPEVKSGVVELDCRFRDLKLDNCFAQAATSTQSAEFALKAAEHITLPSLPTRRRQGRVLIPLIFADASGKVTPPDTVTRPIWSARPTLGEVYRLYPRAAAKTGLVGNVGVDCKVQAGGDLGGCAIQYENPVGYGFGEGALALMSKFRMQDLDAYGLGVEGRHIRMPIRLSPTMP